MPAIALDPNSLTKQKLKDELKHGVTLPSSEAKKSVYVDLYRQVMSVSQRSEFSSDDDDSFGTTKMKKVEN